MAGAATGANGKLAPRHRWLFRILTLIVFPLLILGVLEGALRLFWPGYPTAFFLRRELVPNEKFSWRFFGPELARTPRPMVLPEGKLPQTCRVFLLGESAAYGDPRPDFGLPRVLAVLLRQRFPGLKFEVVNVAMTGINSNVIRPIAAECAHYNGDIWVFYMGNNEVVGPYGAGTVFGARAPPLPLIRASIALKATCLGQLLESVLARISSHRGPRQWGMELFLNNQVRRDEPRLENVYAHFTENLEAMLRIAHRRHVAVVLSTVVTNLKDCAPFGSEHRPGLTEERRTHWEALYHAGCEDENAARWVEAEAKFDQALQLDAQFAELQYRYGACCLARHKVAEARFHFIAARDEDTLRFRADTRLNEIIRAAAAKHAGEGVRLADCETAVSRECADGLAGNEVLYEHVHLNFAGNCRVARQISEQIAQLLPAVERQVRGRWLSDTEVAERLGWTDWQRYQALKTVWLRLNSPPFTGQFDHLARVWALRQQMEHLLPGCRPEALRRQADACRKAVALAPDDWVLQKNLGEVLAATGDLKGAEVCYEEVVRLLPWDARQYLQLGLLLVQSGRPQEAIGQLDQGLVLEPRSVALLNGRALALMRMGRSDEAVATFQRALAIAPANLETHLNLVTTWELLGDKEGANREFRSALAGMPAGGKSENPDLLLRLGRVALSRGWTQAALTNLVRATQLDPTEAASHFYLAGAWAAEGSISNATVELAETVRLAPEHVQARVALGLELRKLGREAEAGEQFAVAARLRPDFLEARLNYGLTLARQGKPVEARREFEAVLQMEPNNQTARVALAALQRQ